MGTLPSSLPIADIILVNVAVASGAVPGSTFNQGLIVGSSAVIPSYGSNPRLRQYATLAAMLTDGFTDDDPEYLAAELYFSQSPAPDFVWIGRQDLTAIETAIPHSGSAGTGYVVGDQITVVQSGGSHGVLTVLTVSTGVVTSLGTTIGNQGTGYANGTGLTTTGGSGTGLEVDITAIGETCLQAVETCVLAGGAGKWYPFMVCGAADADHEALGAYSTANWETLLYFGSSSTSTIPAGTSGNVALVMQAANYKAVLSYNTTQGGTYPNNVYAAAALIGLACGLNTGGPNSAFTLNLKKLAGINPEPLTQTQFSNITAANCNTCATFAAYIGYVYNGICSSGDFFDQLLDRAMLVNLIQTNLMNLLVSVSKVPQTDPGEQQLISQVNEACAAIAAQGWLAGGVWEGANVTVGNVTISTGQALSLGYVSLAPSFNTQSSANKAARQAMPITTLIIEAGAVDSVVVNVNVQL